MVEVKQDKLFLVEKTDYRGDTKNVLMSKGNIVFELEYFKYPIKVLNEVRYKLPEFTLEETSYYSSRCYFARYYDLTSSVKLDDNQLEVLRALGAFMFGQVTGKLVKIEEINGKFVHKLVSERDSGD